MATGRAQHIDQEIRGAVENLRLVTETIRRKHKSNQLRDLFNAIEPSGGIHLREHTERCFPSAIRGLFDRDFVRTAARQELIAIPGDLTSNIKERAAAADRNQPGLYI